MADRRQKEQINVWVPPALKRDLRRLAKSEHQPLSRFCAGMLRLGIGRFFELAGERIAAPLREKMLSVFGEEWLTPMSESFARAQGYLPKKKLEEQTPAYQRRQSRAKSNAAFDAALEEGDRYFETVGG